jgi:cell surface protein SprA
MSNPTATMTKLLLRNRVLFVITAFVGLSFTAAYATDDDWNWGNEVDFSPKSHHNLTTDLDSLKPITDRTGDFISNPSNNPFDLKDPSVIEKKVEYDPATGLYIITEKIGNKFYRPPTYMTFEEYLAWSEKNQQNNYFQQLSKNANGNSSDPLSRFDLKAPIANRGIFGADENGETLIDIQPNGNIDLTFGGDFQKVDNPILTERQRRQGGFDFDMAIQMNVTGTIGSKMKLQTSYNTQASFDFENQMKLEYTGDEDQIIQKIEAGNVSLPLRSSLIQGSQSLFGVKTELQFGRLRVTSVLSQQKSRRKSLQIQGGAQQQKFEVSADQYDENRHFFLSHYNRDKYETVLKNLPQINTLFKITKMEVWVTNTRNSTQDIRDVVVFSDLGEGNATKIHTDNPIFQPVTGQQSFELDGRTPLPTNNANPIYQQLLNRPNLRALDNAVSGLQSAPFSMSQITDFQKVRARKLSQSEYTFHPDLGYVSLNLTLQPDDVLGVSFEYTYNGETFQVGEFSQDVPINPDTLSVLYLKMLKASTPRVDLPIWDLMMKNVYSIGAYQVNQQDFNLDIFYQDPGGAAKRFIPESSLSGKPLIRILNLDNLNRTGDPVPDGAFDFVSGVTINPRNGRIIFPVLEPFGSSLATQFQANETGFREKYVYDELYDSTVFIAREYPEFNRFIIKGNYKSSVSSEISLGAFNIPRGSVTVTAGGQQLIEGQDYDVDYNIGRIKIINEGVLNSGLPVNVSFEDNAQFSFQTKTLIGTRLDYWISDNFTIGGTVMRLSERPFTQKVNIGDDPIANTVYGVDLSLQQDAPFLTKLVDAIPLIDTKAPSSISLNAEAALLRPDHPNVLNQGGDEGGVSYLDDFEGSSSSFDLRNPATLWSLASIPDNSMFPEARFIDSLATGMNRARLSWYQVDQILRRGGNVNDPYTRLVREQEVFPNRSILPGQNIDIRPLDLAFYPGERGPYNYDAEGLPGTSAGVNTDGSLKEPETRWAGIQRAIQTNNFEAANIEFVEFWLMNPFIGGVAGEGGNLYINLGNVSEDILKDSRNFFENGLPREGGTSRTDTTSWGQVPRTQAVTNAFDNDPATRAAQDVGLDGLDDLGEQTVFDDFLSALAGGILGPNALAVLQDDPSSDNYLYYNSNVYDENSTILERYRKFNNPQGNSQSPEGGELSAATNIPDAEDINNDNTLSETEAYFQYHIPIQNNGSNELQLSNYITDVIEEVEGQKWYQFRIPVDQFTSRHGGIQDFRSIRFIRIYLKDFEEPVVMRFARLALVRNQWRRYRRNLLGSGIFHPTDDGGSTSFDMTGVSIEENSNKFPFPYVLPPGVQRERTIGTIADAQQNEQSLALRVCGLEDGDARAVYKTLNLDMRVFKRLKMFVHAESKEDELEPGDMTVFIRMGSDFENNYYEYEIPLTVTPPGSAPIGDPEQDDDYKEQVWLEENSFDIVLEEFKNLKVARDLAGASLVVPYEINDPEKAANKIRIIGNPDLGLVEGMMIGIRNTKDDGTPRCAEVWVNELRVNGFDERGGYAGRARMDMTLADFGQVTVSGNYTSIGWGSLEQRVAERSREEVLQYDIAGSFQLDKFLPKKLGIRLPIYAQYSQTLRTPEYDPYKFDIPLKELVEAQADPMVRDSLREQARTITTIKSVNMTNIRKERTNTDKKPHLWDIENISVTGAYSETTNSDPTIQTNSVRQHRGGLDYGYSTQPNYITPFRKIIKSESKYLKAVKDFNFNPIPNSINFNTGINRRFAETTYRFAGDAENSTWFDKRFMWDRVYGVNWNIARSLNINFNATNNAVIDEPVGRIDTPEEQDSVLTNLRNFGRNKNYTHTFTASYTLPLKKIPFLDWMNVKATYNANYGWSAAALNVDTLGNTILNGNAQQINADLNFEQLYNKSKYLKKINSNAQKRPDNNRRRPELSKTTEDDDDKKKGKKKKKEKEPSAAARAILRPLMLIRKGRFSYSQDYTSVVPGFMPVNKYVGLSQDFSAPGLEYIIGMRPSDSWLDDAAANNWITDNIYLNQQVLGSYSENIDAQLTLEPFKDFRIEMEASRSYSENHSEFFKVQAAGETHQHLTPRDVGTFSVSFFAVNTLFVGLDDNFVSATFKQFEVNREIISQRLGIAGTTHNSDGPDYARGFGRYHQDVLMPAFIAAYTGQDANNTDLNTFNTLPKPNWRLTYNGFSKLDIFKKIFKSFNITHSYQSTLTVNQFVTDLDYDVSDPFKVNPTSQNYFAEFEIPDVVISERFSPLIGIDFKAVNDMTGRFEYKKSRNLAMNFTDFQMNETNTTEIVFSFGYRIKDFILPIKIGADGVRPKNDLNFKFDFSFRDDITVNHLLDQENSVVTRGLKTIRISPSIDYAINKQLNIRLFYDRSQTIPATSASFPITNTQAGLTVRFALK